METLRFLPGEWTLVTEGPADVSQWADYWRPDRVFVLHWHWILPTDFVEKHYCIGFHASDLPHFRGGSPIQNQVKRGVLDTKLTAFRLDAGIDTGPILMKLPLSLRGSPEEVLERCAGLVARMMPRLCYDVVPEIPQPPGGSFYTRKDAA